MTKAELAAQQLEDMGVVVFECPFGQAVSISSPDGFVAVAPRLTACQANAALTHEKWHLKLGLFYSPHTGAEARSRQEARVNRQALMELVPRAHLRRLLQNGLQPYEIADLLEVPEREIYEAMNLYADIYGTAV